MTTDYYRKLFARQWWIVAICVVCLGAGSFLGGRFLSPSKSLYSSAALVKAQFAGTYGDTHGYMATEAALCESTPVLSSVVGNYPGLTAQALAGKTTASWLTGTYLIQISVSDNNAAQAAKLANDIANALINNQQQATQQLSQQAAQQAQSQLSALQNQISQANNDLNQAIQSNNQGNVSRLEAQLSDLRQQMALLQFSQSQTQLSIIEGSPTLALAQQAQPASVPLDTVLHTEVKYTVAGTLLGLVLGIALVFALDLQARRQSGALAIEPAGIASTK